MKNRDCEGKEEEKVIEIGKALTLIRNWEAWVRRREEGDVPGRCCCLLCFACEL